MPNLPMSDEAYGLLEIMAELMHCSVTQAAQRAFILLNLYVDLKPEEELLVRNNRSRSLERLKFSWAGE